VRIDLTELRSSSEREVDSDRHWRDGRGARRRGDAVGTPFADVAAIDDVEEAMRDVVDPELGITWSTSAGIRHKVETDNTATIDMTRRRGLPLTDVIETRPGPR